MSRSKEHFIEATGGFRLGESTANLSPRLQRLDALNKKLLSGVSRDQVDGIMDEIRRLKGIPSDEWDYEDNN